MPHAYIPTGEGAEVLIIDAATQQTVGRLGGLGMMRLSGALRDTVHVPPMSMITIAFDAGEAAPWVLHCHHMGHLQSGMMTELAVSA